MRFRNPLIVFTIWTIVVALFSCQRGTEQPPAAEKAKLPPEPVVTYSSSDAQPGQRVEHGEWIVEVDKARRQLHAQHHPYNVLYAGKLPGRFQPPPMKSVRDFALSKDDLVVIHPGPGEYVHVMEGQRHGYQNLTIGITYTAPGGAPPMHTHLGEEAHVLLEGTILYALGDSIFTMEGPYIVNIPPMVPHSFKNLGENLAELVVIFPTNVWEYDVLEYFPFANLDTVETAAKGGAK
jgi:quercetin dioxygenase-like cupin family protein